MISPRVVDWILTIGTGLFLGYVCAGAWLGW